MEFPNPGHVLDPFAPLWTGEPSGELALDLYSLARAIDGDGLDGDYIDSLSEIASDIRVKICSWYAVGLKAFKIKLFKSWRKRFSSFKEFCERAIGRSSGAVNSWIRAARVMSQLIAMGFDRLPLNPSIALELSRFEPEDLSEAWAALCHEFPDHEMTIEKVKGFLADPNRREPQWATCRLPAGLMEKLRKRAGELGIPVSDLIEELLGEEETEETEETEINEIIETDDDEPRFARRVRCGFAPDLDDDPYYRFTAPERDFPRQLVPF
jgi:hypothetical protein